MKGDVDEQADHSEIEAYNYSVFEGKEDFAGFHTSLQVGSISKPMRRLNTAIQDFTCSETERRYLVP